jgi:Raf kinase inhibitor-like YbhB/YbcL family protein
MYRSIFAFLSTLILCLGLPSVAAAGFEVKSASINNGATISDEQVFNGFGCSGKNVSPELHWTGAPEGTRSFALTMYDPDAPTGSGWWHWIVINLPASTTELPAGAGDPAKHLLPKGAMQGRTDFGKAAYGGPCPPAGDKPHHYAVTVYALKSPLNVPKDASAALIGFNINANKLAEASINATR